MPNIQVLPASTYRRPTPSKFLRFLLGGKQATGSGAIADLSGNGNSGTLNGAQNQTDPWANAGFFSATALDNSATGSPPNSQGGGATVGASGVSAAGGFNLFAQDSVVVCFTCQVAYPGFGLGFIGNSASSPGINIGESSTNTGGLGVSIVDNAINTYAANVQAQFRVADGAVHKIVVMINGNTTAVGDTAAKTIRIFADGTELAPANSGVFSAAAPGNTIPSFGFGVGHTGNPAASGTLGAKVRDLHMYVLPAGAFPKSGLAVARYYALKPELPIPASIMGG